MNRATHKPSCNAHQTIHALMVPANNGAVGTARVPTRGSSASSSMADATKSKHVPQCNPAGSTTTTWLTPQYITQALGPFDLDPATPPNMPWPTAKLMLTEKDDGLTATWLKTDFVWHNPPYGKGMAQWMAKAAAHGNGFTLIFLRADAQYFHDSVLRHPNTTALFFFEGRLKFCDTDGVASGTSASPSVLIAYGLKARNRLIDAVKAGEMHGRLILLGDDQSKVWQIGRKAPRLKKAA